MTTEEFTNLAIDVFGGEAVRKNDDIDIACNNQTMIHIRIQPQSGALFIFGLLEEFESSGSNDLTERIFTDLEHAKADSEFSIGYDDTSSYRQLQWLAYPKNYDETTAKRSLTAYLARLSSNSQSGN